MLPAPHSSLGSTELFLLQDGEGDTPLWLALDKGHAQVAKLLVASGAEKMTNNCGGRVRIFAGVGI